MSKQKKSRRGAPVSPRPVEPEMGAAFPEPCAWPLAWHGEALYSQPTSPSPASRASSER
ncbi:MAG: hypothetical protein AB1435_04255 [Chloroflexota bacterium]